MQGLGSEKKCKGLGARRNARAWEREEIDNSKWVPDRNTLGRQAFGQVEGSEFSTALAQTHTPTIFKTHLHFQIISIILLQQNSNRKEECHYEKISQPTYH
jgi:hypothetical protein